MGGFDVLITSFEREEVLGVTFAAWSRWECEFAAAPPKKLMARVAQWNAAADASPRPAGRLGVPHEA